MSKLPRGATCQGCYHHLHGCMEREQVRCERFISETDWLSQQVLSLESARKTTIYSLVVLVMAAATITLVAWVRV